MPEHELPGVHIVEVPARVRSISGVSTSTAGFVGLAARGPIEPRLVTSWAEFARLYGEGMDPDLLASYLPWAVRGFFENGGQRAYVARAVAGDATIASARLGRGLVLEALGPGALAGRLFCRVLDASSGRPDELRLVVVYFPDPRPTDLGDMPLSGADQPEVLEDYDNLPWKRLAKAVAGSSLVRLVEGAAPTARPESGGWVAFAGGSNGSSLELNDYLGGHAAEAAGLAALGEIDEISILCVPDDVHPAHRGLASGLTNAVLGQCESLRDRFAVLQLPRDAGDGDPSAILPPAESEFAAVYHPWLRVAGQLPGETYFIPPGGHVAGVFARTDTTRGVHKAAANEQVMGPVAGPAGEVPLDPEIRELEQDILNQRNINVIRDFRTMRRGLRIWGARTLAADPEWKYVNVRRLFIYLEESIEKGTQWVVFEPNVEATWARVRESVSDFLMNQWQQGAFAGSRPEEAFFVKADRTTMSQNDIDNGRLICLVGVAPTRPAEFVIFRIGQKTLAANP